MKFVKGCAAQLQERAGFSTKVEKNIDFYCMPLSPPCRAVLLAAKLIGVNLNVKVLDPTRGDKNPELLKMNAQYKVPTINDNGFYLSESRAIITYLFNKYGKDDSLYPKDPQKRAIVDQRLYFDMGTLYESFRGYFMHCILGSAPHSEEKLQKIDDALELLDKILEASDFVAGNSITLADASIMASVSTVEIVGFDYERYPHVSRWLNRCKEIIPDYEEANHEGVLDFKKYRWDLLLARKQKANL